MEKEFKRKTIGRICALVVVGMFIAMTTMPVHANDPNDWTLFGNAGTGSEVLGTNNSDDLRIITNNMQRMVVKAGGNVGINTAIPGSMLEVRGSGISPATSALKVTDNAGNPSLFVRDDGNVGIGTVSPSSTLHIKELTQFPLMETVLTIETSRVAITTGQQIGTIRFMGPYSGSTGAMIRAEASGTFSAIDPHISPTGLKFYTQGGSPDNNLGTARMVITADGRVGIGTEYPDDGVLLHVYEGMERITGSITPDTQFNYVPGVGIQVYNDSDFGGMLMLDRGLDRKDTVIYWGDNPSGPGPDNLLFMFADYAYPGGHGLEERMRITAGGLVGIGETNPTQELHVDGDVRIEGALYDSSNDDGLSGQVLQSTGSGGIDWADASSFDQNLWETIYSNDDSTSTTADSPTDTLYIDGQGIASVSISGDTLIITATEADGDTTNELQNLAEVYAHDGATGNAVQLTATNGDIRFYNDDTTEMLFLDESSGRIGIGSTNPGAKLDVEASSGGAATIGDSSCSATGNYAVAMGSDSSANDYCSFAVGREATADETYSIAMGYKAEASSWGSIAIGISEYSNPGPTASGYASIAIGSCTTASGSRAIALGRLTTASGSDSMAMGLDSIASGIVSTAMGYWTTASGDWGSTAMGYNTTASGDYSTAMGRAITAQGAYSFGIGLDSTPRTITQANTMAIMGGKVGIGTTSPITTLDVNGGFATKIVTKYHTDDGYTPVTSDYTILVDATSATQDVDINLPAASSREGQILVIKRVDNITCGYDVKINRAGTDLIDGDTSKTLDAQWESLTIQSNGSNWYILADQP